MKVAILGLGIIGETWAKNLEADGIPLAVWNRTPKDRPHFVSDPVAAIQEATHILLVVSDVPAVFEIIAKIAPALRPGQILMQCSTITPAAVKEVGNIVTKTGARFLDAPFTGSKKAAEQRQTVYYMGGDAKTIDAVRPVLEHFSKTILHIGEVGAGSALKLAMNLNIAQVAQAMCESLTLARLAGIPDELYFQALKVNVSNSGLTALKETPIRTRDFTPAFSVKHMLKDLRQARELANGHPLPQLKEVIGVYEKGVERGLEDKDFISLIEVLK